MAIDTAARRASAADFGQPWGTPGPAGTIAVGARTHLMGLYRLVDASVAATRYIALIAEWNVTIGLAAVSDPTIGMAATWTPLVAATAEWDPVIASTGEWDQTIDLTGRWE